LPFLSFLAKICSFQNFWQSLPTYETTHFVFWLLLVLATRHPGRTGSYWINNTGPTQSGLPVQRVSRFVFWGGLGQQRWQNETAVKNSSTKH
jgi:hypothetical protein